MKPITRANFAIGAEKEKQYGYRINENVLVVDYVQASVHRIALIL